MSIGIKIFTKFCIVKNQHFVILNLKIKILLLNKIYFFRILFLHTKGRNRKLCKKLPECGILFIGELKSTLYDNLKYCANWNIFKR